MKKIKPEIRKALQHLGQHPCEARIYCGPCNAIVVLRGVIDAPAGVEEIVHRLSITVQQLIALECQQGAEILKEDIKYILKVGAE